MLPASRVNENKKHFTAIRFIGSKITNTFVLKNASSSKSLLILLYLQTMKSIFFLFFLIANGTVFSQISSEEIRLFEKLDSVQHSTPKTKHFARLYITATSYAVDFWQTRSEEERNLNRRFETRFASLFFAAADSFSQGRDIPTVWSNYFRHKDTSQRQLQLLGINAHINGDIWKALVAEFSPAELKVYRTSFQAFNKMLKKQYQGLYEEALMKNKGIKVFHSVTFGLFRWYGGQMLLKWRKRQMKIANLYCIDQKSYLRKEKSLSKKKLRLDKAILKFF